MQAFYLQTQDMTVGYDSIKNNLRIAKLTATDEEIEIACKKASVHEFIMTLPKGYDTPVGERAIPFPAASVRGWGSPEHFYTTRPLCCWMSLPVTWIA